MHARAGACSCSYGHSFSCHPLPAFNRGTASHRGRVSQRSRRRVTKLLAGLSPDQLQDLLTPLSDSLFLAYERVVMPCHNMNCGDVVYRRWETVTPNEFTVYINMAAF